MEDLDTSREEYLGASSSSVDVYIRVSFTKIYDLDTLNQRFQAEAIIESKWHEATLSSLSDEITKSHWKPDLYIENALGEPKEEISHKIVKNAEDGLLMISEIRKVRGVFWENLELENFPLDTQDLTLIIATKKSGSKVNFILMQPETCKVSINSTLDKSMWHLYELINTRKHSLTREYSFGKREYPCLSISCKVFRLPGYFYWNILLPIILILLASLGPFVIDFKLPQSRLPSTATMLLSAVSYKVAVSKLLPTVSYLTSLDKYSIGSIAIITAMLLYHAIIGGCAAFFDSSLAYRVDKFFFFMFLACILLVQLMFVSWLIKVNKSRDDLIDEALAYEKFSGKKEQ